MRRLLIICTFFMMASIGFSQDTDQIAKVNTLEKFEKSKRVGSFEFQLPESATEASVMKNADYYTNYFLVKFDESTKIASVLLTSNEEVNKKIIKRFLVSNGVKQIGIDDKILSIDDFFTTHIMN